MRHLKKFNEKIVIDEWFDGRLPSTKIAEEKILEEVEDYLTEISDNYTVIIDREFECLENKEFRIIIISKDEKQLDFSEIEKNDILSLMKTFVNRIDSIRLIEDPQICRNGIIYIFEKI